MGSSRIAHKLSKDEQTLLAHNMVPGEDRASEIDLFTKCNERFLHAKDLQVRLALASTMATSFQCTDENAIEGSAAFLLRSHQGDVDLGYSQVECVQAEIVKRQAISHYNSGQYAAAACCVDPKVEIACGCSTLKADDLTTGRIQVGIVAPLLARVFACVTEMAPHDAAKHVQEIVNGLSRPLLHAHTKHILLSLPGL